jgi:hypothetical protein
LGILSSADSSVVAQVEATEVITFSIFVCVGLLWLTGLNAVGDENTESSPGMEESGSNEFCVESSYAW